ncbi:hypothetical protein VCRA2119O52_5160002 [Vibrio crassostreae]|nr:hypothetical protein VCRA2119O52_5160002 [Vibrio crassostreae]
MIVLDTRESLSQINDDWRYIGLSGWKTAQVAQNEHYDPRNPPDYIQSHYSQLAP